MDELTKLYNVLLADPLIAEKVGKRIKLYEYPESGDVSGPVIIIDPLSEPLESDYGDDEPITEQLPIQVDVWSRDAYDTKAVAKQITKIFREVGYNYTAAGPNNKEAGIYRSVRRYTGKYYTEEFEGAH